MTVSQRLDLSSSRLIDQLTVIVPRYNPDEPPRISIARWHQRGYRTIILDGFETAEETRSSNRVSFLALGNPAQSPWENWQARLRVAAQMASTEFTCICADDDHLAQQGVFACIRALREDPEKSIACGHEVRLSAASGNAPSWRLDNRDRAILWLTRDRYSSPADATSYLPLNYRISLFYRLMRTEYWRDLIATSFNPDFTRLDLRDWNAQTWSEMLLDQLGILTARIALVNSVVNLRTSIKAQRVTRSPLPLLEIPLLTRSSEGRELLSRELDRVLPFVARFNPSVNSEDLQRLTRRAMRQWGWGNPRRRGRIRGYLPECDAALRSISERYLGLALQLRHPQAIRPLPVCIEPREENGLALRRHGRRSTDDFMHFLAENRISCNRLDLEDLARDSQLAPGSTLLRQVDSDNE